MPRAASESVLPFTRPGGIGRPTPMDPEHPMNEQLESFRYDDAIVRKFLIATFVWGLVGM
mgnify:CR=1 FL=1